MTEREAYVAFNLTDKVGAATVGKLIARYGSAAAAWGEYPNKISRTGGEIEWEREFALAGKFGVEIVTMADEKYPKSLRESPGGPLVLYVKGSVDALSLPSVAMIGTRRATDYGLGVANRFSYDLCKASWCIVSGLALGIDAESHRGALDACGVTVGVLGSGLDMFYPEENRPLAREIVEKGGAVASQFPFGRPADRTTFPIRNHVVAALAKGAVAVEAPARSGTLITANIAAELGRTVMAVPGRIADRMSAGCLQLIREGAIAVRDVDDIIEALGPLAAAKVDRDGEKEKPAVADEEKPAYSVEEAMVMLHVDEEGVSIDELVRETRLPVVKINSIVMTLRVKGFVRFLPGNRVALPQKWYNTRI
jgi:DNA processing protein